MIHVIASIRVKAGRITEFLGILKSNVLRVRQERGCMEYFPAMDTDAGLATQSLDENVVTIIEKWESLETLRDHLVAPHMLDYKDNVKALIDEVSVKVLKEA